MALRQTGKADEVDDEGFIKVFFELNGQPRNIRVAKEGKGVSGRTRRKVIEGDPKQIGAPMPGAIATMSIVEGQRVTRGMPLLSIEAMKMETLLFAEVDGVVASISVRVGDAVSAKELLVEMQ